MEITPTSLAPGEAEIAARLSGLQSAMSREGLDYYLCHDPANIFYLTNFANYVHERPFILLVPASGHPVFLMPKLEEQHVRVRSVGPLEYLHYFEFPAPPGQMWFDRMREVLSPKHRVGIESQCPHSVLEQVPGTYLALDLVDELREIKSDFEIARIAYTCKLLNEAHTQFLQLSEPGTLPIMLYAEVSGHLMQRLLGENPRANLLCSKFNAVCQPPPLSDDPHNFTEMFCTMTEGGPHVVIINGLANGYGAELERTFFLGHVPEACRRPFDDMLEARALAFELAVPGACMSEVDARVNELLKARGYADKLLHRTGHSFGVTDHEGPFLAEGYERAIEPGMVFSIEPGIYLPGTGGFRFSDTVLITESGNQCLTDAPDSLEALTL